MTRCKAAQVSPTPLLIHSVMGVGTNIFPMNAKHIPELQSLLGPDGARPPLPVAPGGRGKRGLTLPRRS